MEIRQKINGIFFPIDIIAADFLIKNPSIPQDKIPITIKFEYFCTDLMKWL